MSQKPPKSSPKCPFLLVRETLEIYNLRTTNAMKIKLTRIVYYYENFHLAKDFGVSFRVWQGGAWKPPKKAQKSGFWAYFLGISNTISKTLIYVMWNNGLHYYCKFGKNLTRFTGARAQKPPKRPQKWHFLLFWKHLNIHNLATIKAVLMKLNTIMYPHATFNLAQNWGVTVRG